MSNYDTTLEILEVEYSCSPGGVDTFEVYDKTDISDRPIYESESLTDAVQYCYNLGRNFTVQTIAAWHKEMESYEPV